MTLCFLSLQNGVLTKCTHAVHADGEKQASPIPAGQLPGRKDHTHTTASDRKQGLPKPKAKQAAEAGAHAS